MKYKDKVTVCIPTYNRANTIGNALKSILKQTYKNIEIIVVDNASTDNTKDVVESFNNKKIKYLYFEDHLEVNYNFVRALNCAESEIICLFHSDDYYYPNIIEEQLKYLLDSKVGAVFSKMSNEEILNEKFLDQEFEITEPVLNNQDKELEEESLITYNYKEFLEYSLLYGIPVACPTFMTKKSVINQVGLNNAKEALISDLSLWLPIAREYEIVDIQKVLMIYGVSKNQLSYKIHHRRCFVSPQFIVLDNELKTCNEQVTTEVLHKYNTRKSKDCLHIAKNLIIGGKLVAAVNYIYKGYKYNKNLKYVD
ncbi:glycosyltransferase family 2 protein [Acetobacterium bakii]|uniref:glycosyltransferase family 2 protein n=1 Tax=Acetobacterium bakii TaxID=52689 RepID=UPI0006823245|nr:glycosyltransferase family 2 protein [Acetobacterium bakii]